MRNNIEKYLTELLQRNISFVTERKTLKQGKLIIYTIKDYIISFTINTPKNQVKIYDVYYPYSIYYDDSKRLTFDYSIETLANGQEQLAEDIINRAEKTHKLFNKKLLILQD